MRWVGHVTLMRKMEIYELLGCENLQERERLEDIGTERRIILKYSCRDQLDGVDWIHLARERNKWRVVVKTVINLGVT
jgi:hypothetical protein